MIQQIKMNRNINTRNNTRRKLSLLIMTILLTHQNTSSFQTPVSHTKRPIHQMTSPIHVMNSVSTSTSVTTNNNDDTLVDSLTNQCPLATSSHQPMRALPDHEQNSEFELKLGKAIDTLRQDYPTLLTSPPDYQIYDEHLTIVDPSGVTLHSLSGYKSSFRFLHMLIKLFYCPKKSLLTYKLAYDCARKNIRVSWNAKLVPRLFGEDFDGSVNRRNLVHVDGISVYELDRETGLIVQHRVERLLVNDAPVRSEQNMFDLIYEKAGVDAKLGENGIPVFYKEKEEDGYYDENMVMNFVPPSLTNQKSMLFSMEDDDNNMANHELFDEVAFQKKNKSRQKFGLKPITEAEFVQIEIKTKELEKAQQQKAASISSAAEMNMSKEDAKKGNFMNKLFGNLNKDTCQDNWDCQRPEVCCDFGFKKMCCSSGMKVFNGLPGQMQRTPVRVVADDDQWQRKGGPEGADWGY